LEENLIKSKYRVQKLVRYLRHCGWYRNWYNWSHRVMRKCNLYFFGSLL